MGLAFLITEDVDIKYDFLDQIGGGGTFSAFLKYVGHNETCTLIWWISYRHSIAQWVVCLTADHKVAGCEYLICTSLCLNLLPKELWIVQIHRAGLHPVGNEKWFHNLSSHTKTACLLNPSVNEYGQM